MTKTHIGSLIFLILLSLALGACEQSTETELPAPAAAATDQPLVADTPTLQPPLADTPTVQPPTEAPQPTEEPMQTTPEATGSSADPSELLTRLHWLGQASFRLDGPPTIYFDPVKDFINEPAPADIILISHDHFDHYDPGTLKRLATAETTIVTTAAIADRLAQDGILGNVTVLAPGDSATVGQIEVEAVPAYNLDKNYHPKEAGNLGFILTIDGVRLYFAGDTDAIPEMADFHPDVALIPIGGTYTMNPQQAVEAVAMLQPLVVVPMHILEESNLATFQELCKDCRIWPIQVED